MKHILLLGLLALSQVAFADMGEVDLVVREAMRNEKGYDDEDIVALHNGPSHKECLMVVVVETNNSNFNVCVNRDSNNGFNARVFYGYYFVAMCRVKDPNPNEFDHFWLIGGLATESPEASLKRAKQDCLAISPAHSTGELYLRAPHGGPDNQRTPATIENSCVIRY